MGRLDVAHFRRREGAQGEAASEVLARVVLRQGDGEENRGQFPFSPLGRPSCLRSIERVREFRKNGLLIGENLKEGVGPSIRILDEGFDPRSEVRGYSGLGGIPQRGERFSLRSGLEIERSQRLPSAFAGLLIGDAVQGGNRAEILGVRYGIGQQLGKIEGFALLVQFGTDLR